MYAHMHRATHFLPLSPSLPLLLPSPCRNLEVLASLGDNTSATLSSTFLPTRTFLLVKIAASSSSFTFYLSPGDETFQVISSRNFDQF